MENGIYFALYELLQNFLFGDAILTNYMDATLTFFSTLGSAFIVSVAFLPFIMLWRMFK